MANHECKYVSGEEIRDASGRPYYDCRQCALDDIARLEGEVASGSKNVYMVCYGWYGKGDLNGSGPMTSAEYLLILRGRLAKIERAEADQRERDRQACERAVGVYGSP